jgi:hypothetical protein
MATSSITKTFKIKDKEALKRYAEIMSKPAPPLPSNKNSLEDGKRQLRKYLSR